MNLDEHLCGLQRGDRSFDQSEVMEAVNLGEAVFAGNLGDGHNWKLILCAEGLEDNGL